jgi:hypothetical protein
VHGPDRRIPRVARAPVTEQRRAVGEVFRFEEELAEGRVRQIVGGRGETISA